MACQVPLECPGGLWGGDLTGLRTRTPESGLRMCWSRLHDNAEPPFLHTVSELDAVESVDEQNIGKWYDAAAQDFASDWADTGAWVPQQWPDERQSSIPVLQSSTVLYDRVDGCAPSGAATRRLARNGAGVAPLPEGMQQLTVQAVWADGDGTADEGLVLEMYNGAAPNGSCKPDGIVDRIVAALQPGMKGGIGCFRSIHRTGQGSRFSIGQRSSPSPEFLNGTLGSANELSRRRTSWIPIVPSSIRTTLVRNVHELFHGHTFRDRDILVVPSRGRFSSRLSQDPGDDGGDAEVCRMSPLATSLQKYQEAPRVAAAAESGSHIFPRFEVIIVGESSPLSACCQSPVLVFFDVADGRVTVCSNTTCTAPILTCSALSSVLRAQIWGRWLHHNGGVLPAPKHTEEEPLALPLLSSRGVPQEESPLSILPLSTLPWPTSQREALLNCSEAPAPPSSRGDNGSPEAACPSGALANDSEQLESQHSRRHLMEEDHWSNEYEDAGGSGVGRAPSSSTADDDGVLGAILPLEPPSDPKIAPTTPVPFSSPRGGTCSSGNDFARPQSTGGYRGSFLRCSDVEGSGVGPRLCGWDSRKAPSSVSASAPEGTQASPLREPSPPVATPCRSPSPVVRPNTSPKLRPTKWWLLAPSRRSVPKSASTRYGLPSAMVIRTDPPQSLLRPSSMGNRCGTPALVPSGVALMRPHTATNASPSARIASSGARRARSSCLVERGADLDRNRELELDVELPPVSASSDLSSEAGIDGSSDSGECPRVTSTSPWSDVDEIVYDRAAEREAESPIGWVVNVAAEAPCRHCGGALIAHDDKHCHVCGSPSLPRIPAVRVSDVEKEAKSDSAFEKRETEDSDAVPINTRGVATLACESLSEVRYLAKQVQIGGRAHPPPGPRPMGGRGGARNARLALRYHPRRVPSASSAHAP